MKKYYVQPTGSWGIIIWSLALSIIFFGIIMQLEIFALSVVPFIIWFVGIVYVFYVISNSWIKVSKDQIIVKEPNYYRARIFDRKDVSLNFLNERFIMINFENHNYFPIKVISTKKVLLSIKREAGGINVISK
ncbi:EbsA family protein [Companilactobacillus baiquanensis]|uniref:EbsA family protein n=1 Tax=Companilactobacillus baiquanensis TaxID=2486005 RepID=A0ABW1UU55_9LACO|nr:EbsA family protein [Companilactobacillus baiquanensis]